MDKPVYLLFSSYKMSDDRAWMYTGRPNQKEITNEWAMKTKEFLRATFANGQRKTCALAFVATTINMRQRWIWVNTCRIGVISLVIRCGPSMVSLPDAGERTLSVSARMSTE